MKKLLIISCSTILLIGFTSVTFADVGVKKVPKKENTYTLPANDFELSDCSAMINYEFNGHVENYVAVLNTAILVPGGKIEYLKDKKPVYKSPDVDRKWIWWCSIITNS